MDVFVLGGVVQKDVGDRQAEWCLTLFQPTTENVTPSPTSHQSMRRPHNGNAGDAVVQKRPFGKPS